MSLVKRVALGDEVSELVDAARGTNEAYEVLTAVDDEIPLEEALATLKRVAEKLPHEAEMVHR
jgi:hypothetical protein